MNKLPKRYTKRELNRIIKGTGKKLSYFKDWKNYEQELIKIFDKYEGRPQCKEVLKYALIELDALNKKYHLSRENRGKFPTGYELKKLIEKGYLADRRAVKKLKNLGKYRDWYDVEFELRKATKRNNRKFPTYKDLERMGYRRLIYVIKHYCGGIEAARRKQQSYYGKYENVERDLKRVLKGIEGIIERTRVA